MTKVSHALAGAANGANGANGSGVQDVVLVAWLLTNKHWDLTNTNGDVSNKKISAKLIFDS